MTTIIRNGSNYITKMGVILNQESLCGSSINSIKSDAERQVNIDALEDWEQAELMFKKS